VLEGGEGNDLIFGDGGADLLLGGAGDDMLSGGAGNDTLEGGPGRDRLDGGPGDDLLRDGPDGGAELRGGDGADTLDAWGGAVPSHVLIGGIGNDTYLVRGAADLVIEEAGGGIDTIFTLAPSGRVLIPSNIEMLVLLGGATQVVGNGLSNRILGNDLAQALGKNPSVVGVILDLHPLRQQFESRSGCDRLASDQVSHQSRCRGPCLPRVVVQKRVQ
jgi:Ca2+-binding RTX toxin-like protein